jgi:hypothetical protein
MLHKPTLIVTRLVVERGERAVYDEQFHKGVNVIRGENSSGKSTILNFIFYGLGGDLAEWSEVALLCTRVKLEVLLNDRVATLSRDISDQQGQPMEVFGGSLDASELAPRVEWTRFPYKRSANLESFSQALFRLLEIPEVANDVSGNLTMHQVLRLLYADQLSPVESLFRFESRFDPPALRDAIGRLLIGAFGSRIYENDVRIRDLVREFDSKSGELKSLFAVLGGTDHNLTLDWIEGQRSLLEIERGKLQQEIEAQERAVFVTAVDDKLTLLSQGKLYEEVQGLQLELSEARRKRDATLLSVADSAAFIGSLEHKLILLNDSSSIAEHLGDIKFSVCPACYSPLDDGTNPRFACHLCKTPFENERAKGRISSMINETALQLKQSRLLQERRTEIINKLEGDLERISGRWQVASARLIELQRLPSSEARDRLRELHRKAGYLEREVEDLEQKARVVRLVDEISKRKEELNNEITHLRGENEKLKSAQQNRLSRAYTEISDQVRILLRNDLRRQDSFERAESIQFDFAANRISVDGHTYFSASSRVILKSSFFLGFFAAATKDAEFRHPRFVMIDTIEDKGMEPERSHNFQNQILRVSQESRVDHQIIYATAMISPDLNDESYTVGKFSTRDDPTIAIQT